MRPAATASDYERVTRPYVFDRIEVAASVFTSERPGNYLAADFDRTTERVAFSVLGAYYCEFPSGPNLLELSHIAASILERDGFYGLRTARRLKP